MHQIIVYGCLNDRITGGVSNLSRLLGLMVSLEGTCLSDWFVDVRSLAECGLLWTLSGAFSPVYSYFRDCMKC